MGLDYQFHNEKKQDDWMLISEKNFFAREKTYFLSLVNLFRAFSMSFVFDLYRFFEVIGRYDRFLDLIFLFSKFMIYKKKWNSKKKWRNFYQLNMENWKKVWAYWSSDWVENDTENEKRKNVNQLQMIWRFVFRGEKSLIFLLQFLN